MQQWPQIVRQHTALVWGTVYRLLNHDADAADCFQEVFVSAWQLSRRQTVSNWPGLLHRLATARALDQLRRRFRERSREQESDFSSEIPSMGEAPSAQAEAAELAAMLARALAELPEQQGVVFSLRHLSGLSYEEIAGELAITVNAVGVALHKATARLRQALSPMVTDRKD